MGMERDEFEHYMLNLFSADLKLLIVRLRDLGIDRDRFTEVREVSRELLQIHATCAFCGTP